MFHWYGLIVGLATVVGWSVIERINSKINKVLPWALIFGFVGARLYHVIDLWEYYLQNLDQIIAVWNGGLGIYGGIIGGIFGIVIYHFTHKSLNLIWSTLGSIVVGLPIGQAIGRVANAVNYEFVEGVWGLPWWSVEAIFDGLLFVIMWELYSRGKSDKTMVGMYLIGYGVIRFVLEFWRVNNWMWGGLGVAQWVSIGSIVIGLSLWQGNVQD